MQGRAAEPGANPGPGFVVRFLASAAFVVFLCAAWGSGIDRLSTTSPALERLVPGPLRAQADRSAAAMALARGDAAAGLVFAAEAVRRDPVDPLSDSLLGSALQYSGDPRRAEAAFRVAAARGWRDRLTQLYWYGAAMEAGDAERAALRADALLRADPYFAAAGTLLEPLEASPQGRAALARRLAENPGWAKAYLSAGEAIDAEGIRLKAGIALSAVQQGGVLDCPTVRPAVGALIGRGLRKDAERLWRAACGGKGLAGSSGSIADGTFEQLAAAGEPSPFGWHKYSSGDVSIEPVAGDDGGHRMSLRNGSSVSRMVLSQALALAPGQYRVRAKIASAAGAGAGAGANAGRIAVSLDCGAVPKRPVQLSGDAAGSGQVLSIGACDSQLLGLWLRPDSEVTIDDVAIESVK